LGFVENRKSAISCITQQDVIDFIVYINTRFSSSSIRTVLCALRSFFKYLEQENLIQSALLLAIPTSSFKKSAVIKILTVEDENNVLDVANTDAPEGKRNKAIVLLAMRLGLRMSDILGLKFENVDWKYNTISIVQHKTKSLLQLPLLNDVGNAIADYIINGRPETDDRHIFIRHHAPYCRLTEAHDISSKIFDAAGINQVEGDKKGLHVYRHSLASKLLSNGTALPAISSILGHADRESSQVYISTDAIGMRKCPLTLKGIEPNMGVLG
jgi:site-specific recombinase XerD